MEDNFSNFPGILLRIDLTNERILKENIPEKLVRTFMGGPGLGAYLMLNETKAGINPFSPENMLVFSCGLLTGTPSPCAPRFTIVTRSPLTGAMAKSEAGGWWGPALRRNGYLAIVVTGKAKRPVYIWLNQGTVEIRDAAHIWKKGTKESQAVLREELHEKKARVLQIGLGGVNRIRYANVCNDLTHFNGRNGIGAVMGSKLLKAIVVKGDLTTKVTFPDVVQEIARWAGKESKNNPLSRSLHEMGTPAGIEATNALRALPTRNWNEGFFEEAGQIGGEKLNSELLVKRGGCYGCPINCKRVVAAEAADGSFTVDPAFGGPEYETLASFGSNCGIDNITLIAKAGEICNKYGIDTISTGMAISFAMDCYEGGLIGKKETEGMELRFGNSKVLLPLIEKIVRREGIGDILAEGTVRAAEKIGSQAKRLLLTVKGQEIPMHDPRIKKGFGLQYALGPFGADHWVAQHDPVIAVKGSPTLSEMAPLGILEAVDPLDLGPGKVRFFYYSSLLIAVYDLLGICIFGAVSRSLLPINKVVELAAAVTGWNTSLWELMKAGERLFCLARIFNAREGFNSAADVLPERLFQTIAGSTDKDKVIDTAEFQKAVELYYLMAGMDPLKATPTIAKLHELDLGWASRYLGL